MMLHKTLCLALNNISVDHGRIHREGAGVRTPTHPPGKSQVAIIMFPSKYWYGLPLEKQLDPSGPIASRGAVRTALCEIR